MVVVATVPQGGVSRRSKTPPPRPLPEAERGSRRSFSPSPLRGGGRGEGSGKPQIREIAPHLSWKVRSGMGR